eukprot:s2237_g2.t1
MAAAVEEALKKAALAEAENAVKAREATLAHVGYPNFGKSDHEKLEPDDWRHTDRRDDITSAELQLAKRCHGAHIETLSQEVTAVGSHYLLIHYDVPYLNAETFRLTVCGLVEKELSLSLPEIRSRPSTTQAVLMACAGTGRMSQKHRFWTHVPWGVDSFGCAEWTGCSLADLLKEAGLKPGAKQVIFTGADKGVEGGKVQHFQRSLSVDDALLGHVMLVYRMNGEDLKPAHGAPLRIIVPGWYGMASVKWLTSIEVTEGGWWGHQMEAYSFRRAADDPGRVPLTQLPVRALMAPPGFPDFFSRARVVAPGTHRVVGKAWAGAVEIDRVEFSADHGKTWARATLERTGKSDDRSPGAATMAAVAKKGSLAARAAGEESADSVRQATVVLTTQAHAARKQSATSTVVARLLGKILSDGSPRPASALSKLLWHSAEATASDLPEDRVIQGVIATNAFKDLGSSFRDGRWQKLADESADFCSDAATATSYLLLPLLLLPLPLRLHLLLLLFFLLRLRLLSPPPSLDFQYYDADGDFYYHDYLTNSNSAAAIDAHGAVHYHHFDVYCDCPPNASQGSV